MTKITECSLCKEATPERYPEPIKSGLPTIFVPDIDYASYYDQVLDSVKHRWMLPKVTNAIIRKLFTRAGMGKLVEKDDLLSALPVCPTIFCTNVDPKKKMCQTCFGAHVSGYIKPRNILIGSVAVSRVLRAGESPPDMWMMAGRVISHAGRDFLIMPGREQYTAAWEDELDDLHKKVDSVCDQGGKILRQWIEESTKTSQTTNVSPKLSGGIKAGIRFLPKRAN